MHIYIDEAGNFLPTSRPNYISCVVGLIVPAKYEECLFSGYLQLRTSWGSPRSEIKGSSLDEKQVKRVLQLLSKYDALAEISAIGTTDVESEGIDELKAKQAAAVTAKVTEQIHPAVVESLVGAKERVLRTSNQLHLQYYALTRLCDSIIRVGTGFWSQRVPNELGAFKWRIDAKDKTITQAEELWKKLSKPFLESASLSNPGAFCDSPDFDYSHFERFMMHEQDDDESATRHLRFLRGIRGESDSKLMKAINLKKLFADLEFGNSADSIGLQLADVVASAFHRACKGTLRKDGWKWLSPLFVNRRETVVSIVIPSNDPAALEKRMENNTHLIDVLETLKTGARSMMLEAGL